MSSHSNASNAHDFFYQGVDNGECHSYSGCTLNYDKNTARSYSTAIAKVIPMRGFKQADVNTHGHMCGITILSYDCMSATTAHHISLLENASPFMVIRLPMRRGSWDFTANEIAEYTYKELEYLATVLNKIENRRKFAELLQARSTLLKDACEEWAKPFRHNRFSKFASLDTEKCAKELQAKNRKDSVKKAKETKALFKKYLGDKKGAEYIEFIRALFEPGYTSEKFPFTYDEKSLIKSKFANSQLAYVWVREDEIVTSRNARVPLDSARVAMQAWALGHDMRMFDVGRYQIVKYEGNEIQIGCHHIPRENMIALYEAVMGKPFHTPIAIKAE